MPSEYVQKIACPRFLNNYTKNKIENYEGYYASVIYAYLASLGIDMIAEDVTNKGRIDLTLKLQNFIYILEFKVDGDGKAMQTNTKMRIKRFGLRGWSLIRQVEELVRWSVRGGNTYFKLNNSTFAHKSSSKFIQTI